MALSLPLGYGLTGCTKDPSCHILSVHMSRAVSAPCRPAAPRGWTCASPSLGLCRACRACRWGLLLLGERPSASGCQWCWTSCFGAFGGVPRGVLRGDFILALALGQLSTDQVSGLRAGPGDAGPTSPRVKLIPWLWAGLPHPPPCAGPAGSHVLWHYSFPSWFPGKHLTTGRSRCSF